MLYHDIPAKLGGVLDMALMLASYIFCCFLFLAHLQPSASQILPETLPFFFPCGGGLFFPHALS